MDEQITHLVVNWINVEDDIILVGATDNERWRWDTEEGASGGDAKTIVYVTLTDNGKGVSVSEQASFHCLPGDETRTVAMSYLPEMFEIAWSIKNQNLDFQTAREKYFTKEIGRIRINR